MLEMFGPPYLRALHERLGELGGEQSYGTAFLLPTGHPLQRFVAHTVCFPFRADAAHLALRAVLRAVVEHNTSHPAAERIATVACPGLGTYRGCDHLEAMALQMVAALDEVARETAGDTWPNAGCGYSSDPSGVSGADTYPVGGGSPVDPALLEDAAQSLLADLDARCPLRLFSAGACPAWLNLSAAYALQDRLCMLRMARGEAVIGFKVGCMSARVREALGICEAVHGRLWSGEQHASGAALEGAAFRKLAIEGEVAVRLVKEPQGPVAGWEVARPPTPPQLAPSQQTMQCPIPSPPKSIHAPTHPSPA